MLLLKHAGLHEDGEARSKGLGGNSKKAEHQSLFLLHHDHHQASQQEPAGKGTVVVCLVITVCESCMCVCVCAVFVGDYVCDCKN